MRYFVVHSSGQKFGPADIPTLNQWILEGRVHKQTLLEDELTEQRAMAEELTGLVFPAVPVYVPPAQAPVAPVQRPGSIGDPLNPMSAPTEQAASAASPYPRQSQYMPGSGAMPAELQGKFNWGAFGLTFIWGLNHRAYLTLLGLITYATSCWHPILSLIVGLGLRIWFGMAGNQWAWSSGRFNSAQSCQQTQKAWAPWGILVTVLFVLSGVSLIVVTFLGFSFLQQIGYQPH